MPVTDIYAVHKGTGLSSSSPLGSPHLIDLEKYKATGQNESNTDLRLADGIVTLLYACGEETLARFLDENTPQFNLTRTDFITEVKCRIDRDGDQCNKYLTAKLPHHLVQTQFKIDRKTGVWVPEFVSGGLVGSTAISAKENAAAVEKWGGRLAHEMVQEGFGKEDLVGGVLIDTSWKPPTKAKDVRIAGESSWPEFMGDGSFQ